MKIKILCTLAGSWLLVLISCYSAQAQQYYEWKVGAGVGVMNYYGDVSYKFNSTKFSFPAYYASIGKNISPSFSLQLQASYGQITANDRTSDFEGDLQTANPNFGRALNFKTDIRSANIVVNYRFDNGRILSAYAPISPYLFAGVGVTDFTVYGDLYGANGNRYYYWSDNTIRNQGEKDANPGESVIVSQDGKFETELSKLDIEKSYPTTVLSIPFGVGVQFRLSERVSAALQVGATYAFTDYLDDVSGLYRADYPSELQFYAANPSSANRTVRGQGKDNNDLYFSSFVTLNYHFGYRRRAFRAPLVYTGYNQPGSAVQKDLQKPQSAPTTSPADSLISSKKPAPAALPTDTMAVQSPVASTYNSNLSVRDNEGVRLRVDSIRNAALGTERPIQYRSSNTISQEPALQATSKAAPNQWVSSSNQERAIDTTAKEKQIREAVARKQTQGLDKQQSVISKEDRSTNSQGLTEEEQRALAGVAPQNRVYVIPQGGVVNSQRDTTVIIGQTVTGQSETTDAKQLQTDLTALRTELTQLRSQKTMVRDPAMTQKLDSLLTLVSTLETSATKTVIGPLPDSPSTTPVPAQANAQLPDSIRITTTQNDSLILALKDQVQSLNQSLLDIRSGLTAPKEPAPRKTVEGYSNLIVYYGVNKADISESDKQRLAILANKLKSDRAVKLNVKGYTDQTGNQEYNLMLSRKRAENIVGYLTSQLGVDMNQILVNYYGQAETSVTKKSNPNQRKVELELFIGE